MNEQEQDFIKRLTDFLNTDFEKGELNDREQIKEQLTEEFKDL